MWGLSQGDEAMLMEIARDVESLEHPDHPAKGITAKREKSRQQALDELRDAIIPACVQEAEEWGFDLDFDVTDDDGFVIAWFRVKNGDNVHQSIGVDGWSGRLLQKNGLPEYRYTHPEQVQALLGEAISDVADQLTAA
ncbi:hypothetical protein IIC45_00845 [Patescibacteria group bacterium]|nr:hypothetical protein [Patescibacteria group bacterium]